MRPNPLLSRFRDAYRSIKPQQSVVQDEHKEKCPALPLCQREYVCFELSTHPLMYTLKQLGRIMENW